MTASPRLSAPFAVRLTALLSVALVGAAVAGLSAARDPAAPPPKNADKPGRPPEEEDTNAPPVTHKVNVEEPDESGKAAPAPRAVDLRQAARDAKHGGVRTLFNKLAVPHDLLKYDEAHHSKQLNIQPIPDYIGDKPEQIKDSIEVTPFADASWKPEAPVKAAGNALAFITPYEELALRAVDDFLNAHYDKAPDPKDFLSRYDQDVAAEQALTTVLLRLQSARQTGGRKGEAWEPVEEALKQKLLGVMLEQLDALVQKGDWDAAFALTQRLAATYHSQADQEHMAGPLAGLVKQTLAQSIDDAQKSQARRRLRQLYELFPDNPAIRPAAEALQEQANSLFAEAKKELEEHKNPEQVARLLDEAEDAWPALTELRTYRLKLGNEHRVLRVGVRDLPAWMSPGRAVTNSDRRAVELLFESLVKLRPDGEGGARWAPGLAERLPRMAPHGRDFTLPTDAYWSNHERLTAIDVRETVDRMAKGQGCDRAPVWGDLIEQPVEVTEPTRFRLTLRQGWLDPLALVNFKVLPSGADAASEKFAQHPLGSGPYVFAGEGTDNGRPCKVFTANPYYGARPGKAGLPRIEEIHFLIARGDAAAEFASKPGRLDLMLDLTAKQAADLKAKASSLGVTLTGPATPNRRIWFLAPNHRKPALGKAAFRCALAYAINRDKLLDDDFRAAPGQSLHTALNGPYPVKSWAADPELPKKHDGKIDPFDAEAARAKKAESAVGDTALSLKYPAGDPVVEKAMRDLAAQVKEAIGVTLTPEPVPPDELRKDVEETHAYDLAYYHYDFPDDVYWLGPLLDPRAGPAGENYLGYSGTEKGEILTLVRDECRRRDFPQVQQWAHELHAKFLTEEMPFVPLWQLDPLAAIHNDIAMPPSDPPFDPLLVFTDVEQWKLNRK